MYLDGGMGGGGWLLTSFFSIIYILGLVCYKHTIHDNKYMANKPETASYRALIFLFSLRHMVELVHDLTHCLESFDHMAGSSRGGVRTNHPAARGGPLFNPRRACAQRGLL